MVGYNPITLDLCAAELDDVCQVSQRLERLRKGRVNDGSACSMHGIRRPWCHEFEALCWRYGQLKWGETFHDSTWFSSRWNDSMTIQGRFKDVAKGCDAHNFCLTITVSQAPGPMRGGGRLCTTSSRNCLSWCSCFSGHFLAGGTHEKWYQKLWPYIYIYIYNFVDRERERERDDYQTNAKRMRERTTSHIFFCECPERSQKFWLLGEVDG